MKYFVNFMGVLFCLCFLGCVTSDPIGGTKGGAVIPERYSLPPSQQELPKAAEGAIYNGNSKNIYQDTRARNIGDIVMVKIVETSSGVKNAETKTSKDTNFKGGFSDLFGIEKIYSNITNYTPSLTSINAILAKDFEGKGDTQRSSTVTATISARVMEVTMNGNLIIRGYREVRVNNETQHIILSGIIRPEDISQDNSILSSVIADARIEYNGTGVISNKQQPGWFANVTDVLWPF